MTQLLRELQNGEKLESIDKIQFSLFSHEDIKKGAVADILTFDTYEGNIPKNNGLFDHNMGSIDAAIFCPVDEKKAELCPGYFGKIDLALPVFNPHFISITEKVLKCVCFHCSNLLVDKEDPSVLSILKNKKGQTRFKLLYELSSKNKKCIHNGGCQALQPMKYTKTKDQINHIRFFAEFSQNTFKNSTKASNIENFSPLVIYQIFKKIKNEDIDFLGLSSKYSRPEWMIITSLNVPPPSVRPSIKQSDNKRSEDDLTYALSMIVKANKQLKNEIDKNPENKKKIDNYQSFLQYHVSTYMDNEIPNVKPQAQRSTYRPIKAITQRLKGKEGRLRMNIMGKRVDYSARTVISVDPNLNIDQFGVPQKIAMNLTFPEVVNKYNIEKLRANVLNGPHNYPGAKTITKGSSGNQINISLKHVDVVKQANELEIGNIVHRHLVDGDPCLFNRQPTLHKMSMMTHKIVILPFSTFRLNVTVCKPYNADFDGDEMNMHIPQSIQTQTELEQISLVHENLISPGNSKPSIEIVQDTLIGAYLMTIKDVKITEIQMYNYMAFSKSFNGKLPEPEFKENGLNYWSGKQLFSLILPDINISQLDTVKIIHGQVKEGYLSEKSLGSNPSGLIKQIYNAYGTKECVNFLNNTQTLVTRWMMDNSFSISFGDSILKPDERKTIREITDKYYDEAYELIKMAHFGTFATELDDSLKFLKMESELGNVLSKLSEEVKNNIMDNISKSNNFYISGNKGAGSKGKSENMQQIMGVVGQQSIWGNRIDSGFSDRTLPHFYKNDIGPDAKGYCRNNFIEGLSPSEMFFAAMGGRCGSIDTAIQTADSGYISRKLIKAQEDIVVNYDLSVRNSSGHIVQFGYGDDSLDPTKIEKIGRIELFELNNEELMKKYKFEQLDSGKYFENYMTHEAVEKMMEDDDYIGLLNHEYSQIIEYRSQLRNNYFKYTEAIGDVGTHIPINLYREIPSQLIKFNIEPHDLSDLTPNYIIEQYDKLMKDLVQYLPEKEENWKLFKVIFKSFLSSKRLICEYRMNKMAFDDLIVYMKNKMLSALITPGEMVGIIGAQTLGEISTQLTLNTFHLAGIGAASKVITEGVPRLKEILRLSKNLKAKNMKIYLKEEYANDKESAKKIQPKFAYTQIKDILDSSEIIYGGPHGNTSNNEDMEFIQSYKEFSELFDIDNIDEEIMSPWILRLTFDKEALMNKKITIQEIQEAIKEGSNNEDEIECIYSDDSAQDVIMRIRIKQEPSDSFLDHMRDFEKQLSEFSLRGIKDIENVLLSESNLIKYNLDGSIEPSKEWILETNGSNLLEILNHDQIDVKRTVTNDILEFHEIFGIEATRELIYKELGQVFKDKHPNPRHIQMLVDIMTYRGTLMQIERHGMNKNPEVGPIAKASFEEVMNILTNSAVFAESDNMKGVSSNILAGQFCKNGTNSFEIFMDEDKLIEEVSDNDYLIDNTSSVKPENIDTIMGEMYSKKEQDEQVDIDDFDFGFGMEDKPEFMLSENKELQLTMGELTEQLDELNIDNLDLEEIPEDNGEIDELELEDIPTENIEVIVEKPKRGRKKKNT